MKTPQDIRLDQLRMELINTKQKLTKRTKNLIDTLEILLAAYEKKLPLITLNEYKATIKELKDEL